MRESNPRDLGVNQTGFRYINRPDTPTRTRTLIPSSGSWCPIPWTMGALHEILSPAIENGDAWSSSWWAATGRQTWQRGDLMVGLRVFFCPD